MPAVIPRWEWRTFAPRFGDVEVRMAALRPGNVQESDEVYLLSPTCDANVKVRDALMDIKVLEQVNAEGLQQWRPVTKAEFPLAPDLVANVCDALEVAPIQASAPMTLAALLGELAQPSRGVRAVSVHKRRQRYMVGECLAELTGLTADGKPIRSIAIESEDPDRLHAALQEIGLGQFENQSYPRGLKRLLNWPG
jgi:exopolyphosphatase/guanosine-5'-triphosphate,3'-diphosphate pyrophosphatase